jgi:hypothetical protein
MLVDAVLQARLARGAVVDYPVPCLLKSRHKGAAVIAVRKNAGPSVGAGP